MFLSPGELICSPLNHPWSPSGSQVAVLLSSEMKEKPTWGWNPPPPGSDVCPGEFRASSVGFCCPTAIVVPGVLHLPPTRP